MKFLFLSLLYSSLIILVFVSLVCAVLAYGDFNFFAKTLKGVIYMALLPTALGTIYLLFNEHYNMFIYATVAGFIYLLICYLPQLYRNQIWLGDGFYLGIFIVFLIGFIYGFFNVWVVTMLKRIGV